MGLGPNLIPPPPSLITSAKTVSYKVTFTGTGGSVFSIFWGRGGCNSTCNTELRAALWSFHGRERKFKSLGGVGDPTSPSSASPHWPHALFFFSLGEMNDISSLFPNILYRKLFICPFRAVGLNREHICPQQDLRTLSGDAAGIC